MLTNIKLITQEAYILRFSVWATERSGSRTREEKGKERLLVEDRSLIAESSRILSHTHRVTVTTQVEYRYNINYNNNNNNNARKT